MIKFKEQDGELFRMLDKPVPLTADAELPCLIRPIQDDSPMGRYVKQCWGHDKLFMREYTICGINADMAAKVGFARDTPLSIHMFEIIGTFVKEGSDKWALHQMMQGKKVRHKSYPMPKTHCAMNEKRQIAIFTTPSSMIDGGDVICHANDWLTSRQVDTMIDERTGWQIYEEPEEEPELPKEQKIDSGKKEYTCLVCGKKMSGLDGMAEVSIKRISISSLYESTLSHYCGKCFLELGFDKTEKELRNRQQPQVESEPQTAKEPIANCENCKHVCTNSNIDHCYMYEPKPESQYKVGDWVEVEETATGEIEHHTVERVNTFCPVLPDYLVDDVWFNHNGMEITPLDCTFNHRRITRKLSPSEVVVQIGCLSGTIGKSCEPACFLMWHSSPRIDFDYSIIKFSALDTPTRKIVEGLLEAQERGDIK
ncbi:MAG: hypothetical protein RBT65_12595 [Methanolobus sp.]|nr:hypothetical protein [Methanolobus sp.]